MPVCRTCRGGVYNWVFGHVAIGVMAHLDRLAARWTATKAIPTVATVFGRFLESCFFFSLVVSVRMSCLDCKLRP